MEELSTTIYGLNVLITGFGRITKVMVKALIGLGANVSITARKYSDLAWARIYGCEAIHISELDSYLPKFDLLYNTVPAVILDEKRQKLQKEILALEKKVQREKQFNRQIELNAALKQLNMELEGLL